MTSVDLTAWRSWRVAALGLLLVAGLLAAGSGCGSSTDEEPAARGRPLILAHRGLVSRAPENSMAAVRAAFEIGADGVEVDVRVTADGDAVIFHDEALGRLTPREGVVQALPLAELVRIPYLDPITKQPTEERITALDAFLDAFGGKGLLFLELKTPTGENAAALRGKLVGRVGTEIVRRGLVESTLVSSLDVATINAMEKAHPVVRTVYEFFPPRSRLEALPDKLPETTPRTDWIGPEYRWINGERVRWARRHYAGVSTFTPNLLEDIVALARDGVSLIQTDAPEMALRWRAGKLDLDSGRGRRVLVAAWPTGPAVDGKKVNEDGSIDVALPEASMLTTTVPARPGEINFVSFEMASDPGGAAIGELLFIVVEQDSAGSGGTRVDDLRERGGFVSRVALNRHHVRMLRAERGKTRLSATFRAGRTTRRLEVVLALEGGPHRIRCGKLSTGVVDTE